MRNYSLMVLFFFISSCLFSSLNGQFVCPAQFGDFPNFNTEKCTTYFKCINGIPVLSKCPEKEQFDFVFATCKKDKDVNCHLQKEMLALSAATLGGGAVVAPGVLQGAFQAARGGGQVGNQFAGGQWGVQGQGPIQGRWQGQFPAQGRWQGQFPNQRGGGGQAWGQRGGQGQFGRAFPGQRGGVQGQIPGQWGGRGLPGQGNGFPRNGLNGGNNGGFDGVGNRPNFPGFRAGINNDGRQGFNRGWQQDGFGRWNGNNGRGINNGIGQRGLAGQNPGFRQWGGGPWVGNRGGVNAQGGRWNGQGNRNGLNPALGGGWNGQRNGNRLNPALGGGWNGQGNRNGLNPALGGGWNGQRNGNGLDGQGDGWDGIGNRDGIDNDGFWGDGFGGVNQRNGRRLFLDETPIPPIGFFPFQLNGDGNGRNNNGVRAFADGEAQNLISDETEKDVDPEESVESNNEVD